MRPAAQFAVALLVAFAGLASYELVVLAGIVVAIGIGVANFVTLSRHAKTLKSLQDAQGERIDRLPPPPEE